MKELTRTNFLDRERKKEQKAKDYNSRINFPKIYKSIIIIALSVKRENWLDQERKKRQLFRISKYQIKLRNILSSTTKFLYERKRKSTIRGLIFQKFINLLLLLLSQ